MTYDDINASMNHYKSSINKHINASGLTDIREDGGDVPSAVVSV